MNRERIQATLDAFGEMMAKPAHHENLAIRAWLYSPISHDIIGGSPLDDLLCVAVLNYLQIPIDDLGDMHPVPVAIPVPLAKVEVEGIWIYATSWRRYPAHSIPMVRRKRKHFHESRFVAGAKIDTKSGKFRSYDLVSSCMAAPFVEWTVRGDRFWISRLLPMIASLGKDRNAGLGTVAAWEVAGTLRDPLVVDGAPQRSLPCPSGDLSRYADGSCALAERTVRPPYVWPGSKMMCAVPECAQ